jgi:transcriptional regulator with XRE-family HTH domain
VLEKVYEIFAELLRKHGMTPYQVYKATGVAQSSLSDWKNGKSKPKFEKMMKIADYFGISISYLMTGKEPEQNETPALIKKDEREITFDDFTYAFLDEAEELTEENKAKLLEMAKFFKQQQEKEKSEH